jgi:hypothetical protein
LDCFSAFFTISKPQYFLSLISWSIWFILPRVVLQSCKDESTSNHRLASIRETTAASLLLPRLFPIVSKTRERPSNSLIRDKRLLSILLASSRNDLREDII